MTLFCKAGFSIRVPFGKAGSADRFYNKPSHFFRSDRLGFVHSDIACTVAGIENFLDRVLYRLRRVRIAECQTEHERDGQNGRDRVGDALASDIRRRAVDRLVQAEAAFAEGSGAQHADGARQHGSLVAQDIPEHVLRHDDVEARRTAKQLHGAVVDEHMLKLHLRILRRDPVHDLAPEAGSLQHVGFVDGGKPLAARHGDVERLAHDALHLLHVVHAGVDRLLAMLSLAAELLAEVDAARQLAHDDQVGTLQHFRLQGRGILQAVEHCRRADVGEEPERLADAEKPGFRTELLGVVVPFRPAYRAEQDGIRLLANFQRFLRKRSSFLVDGDSAEQAMLEFKAVFVQLFDFLDHLDGFADDFRSDSVARDHRDFLYLCHNGHAPVFFSTIDNHYQQLYHIAL
ncbi:Glutamine amidotransferases class-II [Paenibacillus sp. P22]|nr:Glutamine amidotransferases class-II [Paenibacillus sp. P22]